MHGHVLKFANSFSNSVFVTCIETHRHKCKNTNNQPPLGCRYNMSLSLPPPSPLTLTIRIWLGASSVPKEVLHGSLCPQWVRGVSGWHLGAMSLFHNSSVCTHTGLMCANYFTETHRSKKEIDPPLKSKLWSFYMTPKLDRDSDHNWTSVDKGPCNPVSMWYFSRYSDIVK